MRRRARTLAALGGLCVTLGAGCAGLPPGGPAGITADLAVPALPPPAPPAPLPGPPAPERPAAAGELPRPRLLSPVVNGAGELRLNEVLAGVATHFPLLLAAEQERVIAAGQRLAAEGAFDLGLKARASAQEGTFDNERLDVSLEQAAPLGGVSTFAGYRLGGGEFPVYYGDRKTAEGGEFRGGLQLPLLRDAAIDRRRALLRQAQLGEALAEPVVLRARIDYSRSAARAYWAWVAAGQQYRVAEALLRIANNRQEGLEQLFKAGQIAEFAVIDNRRLIVEREGNLIAAERRWQQTAIELSLLHRDAAGRPMVPDSGRLPPLSDDPPPADGPEVLAEAAARALANRPELARLAAQKERLGVDLALATNQTLPGLNLVLTGAQDVGKGKKGTGSSALDRSAYEGAVQLDVPLQRREARGRSLAARAGLAQLLAQERYAREQITAEVQDALSNLDRTRERLRRAREEQQIARRVAELELDRFTKGQGTLLEVNLRELSAAAAQGKVIDAVADLERARADYFAALGLDATGRPVAQWAPADPSCGPRR